MERRALIIYCDDIGKEVDILTGPPYDNANYRAYLQSMLGGEWRSYEIESLRNPNLMSILRMINSFMAEADYTFIIFTGHGSIDPKKNNMQYLDILGGTSIPITTLFTKAKRQTLIIDACRGYYTPEKPTIKKFSALLEDSVETTFSTRLLFNRKVRLAEEGITILYAASENQSARDTPKGAAYLLSLLDAAEIWKKDNKEDTLSLKQAHNLASRFIGTKYKTIQIPTMELEKREKYFPFAVKVIPIVG